MASLRYIVPALAVASGVSAQFGGSPCSASEPMTISSQAQATQLASCSTFQGSITVANGTSESAIDLSGIGHITGDLIFEGSGDIQSITATQLAVIDGAFSLTSLTSLTALNFPSLSSAGSIAWNALPSVSQLSFGAGVQMLKSLNIQNTGLQSLQGINLATVDSLFIVNNLDLSDITMQLGNVTQALTIANNGAQISISFPNLIWANNATIRGAASISTPSLKIVNGSLGFYSGTNQAYSAPNLTAVGSALSFVSNANLNNISLPSLKAIGGALYVVNNTNLENVTFPALESMANVFGQGSFQDFELPALKLVTGAFSLASTADIQDTCNNYKKIAGPNSIIRGKFTCPANSPNSTTSGGSSGTSSGSSSETSKGAASNLILPSTTGFLGLVAVMFGLL